MCVNTHFYDSKLLFILSKFYEQVHFEYDDRKLLLFSLVANDKEFDGSG